MQNAISVFAQTESRAKIPWTRPLLLLRTIYMSLTTGSTKIDPSQIVQGRPRSINYKSFRVHQDRSNTNRSGSTKIDQLKIVQGPPRLINYKSLITQASRSSQTSKYEATHKYSQPHVQSVPITRTSLCMRKTASAIIRQS